MVDSVHITSSPAAGEFVCVDICNAVNLNEKVSLRVFSECPVFNQAKALIKGDMLYNVECSWSRTETIGKESWEREIITKIKLISFEKCEFPKDAVVQLAKSASSATIGVGQSRFQVISDLTINDKGYISFVIANNAATEERYVMRCFPDAPYYELAKKLKKGDLLWNVNCTLAKRSVQDHTGKYRDDYLFGMRTFEKIEVKATENKVEKRDIKPLDIPLGFGE